MYSLDQKIRPHPEVVDTALDDNEVVLLHLETKTYFSLNPTGARIWELLKSGRSLGQAGQDLLNDFDVDEEQANRSVLELVDQLAQQNLIQVID